MSNLEKLISEMSDETKEALLKLLSKAKNPTPKEENKESKIKVITAQELSKTSGMSKEEKKSLLINNGVDNIIAKQVKTGKLKRTERIVRNSIIEAKCKRCGRTFKVSTALLKTDGKERYYVCNNCDGLPTTI